MDRVLNDIKNEIQTNKNIKVVKALKLYQKVLQTLNIKDGLDLMFKYPQAFSALKELLALIQKKCEYCEENKYDCDFVFPCCCCRKDLEICKYFIKFEPTGARKAYPSQGRGLMKGKVMFESIGYSVGGSMDIKNFRENIKYNYLPKETDITYEGIFYDYYFDTRNYKPKNKSFYPTYSVHIESNPFNYQTETFMTVGFNSNIKDFRREPLDLVIVLDISSSMDSELSKYYYDRFFKGEKPNKESKTAMEAANECITYLIDKLTQTDRLGIVLFNEKAKKFRELEIIRDPINLKNRILQIKAEGATNMEEGYKLGSSLFKPTNKEKRIIFITDAMPNIGGTESTYLQDMIKENSEKKIYTTFVGVGIGFNSVLIDFMSKVRGANYYSVHDPKEFKKRLVDEFDFMVTPLIFDVELLVDSKDYNIEEVYGTPDADKTTGKIMYVNTLFPSSTKEGEVRGGVVLIKLIKLNEGSINLTLKYKDKKFKSFEEKEIIRVKERSNFGIQKAILLSRYVSLIREWINADEKLQKTNQIGWERGSKDLIVSQKYQGRFNTFLRYFNQKFKILNDNTLEQEIKILEKLKDYKFPTKYEFVLDKGEYNIFRDIIIIFENFEIRTKRTEIKVNLIHRRYEDKKETVIFYQGIDGYKLEYIFYKYKIKLYMYYIVPKPLKVRVKFFVAT